MIEIEKEQDGRSRTLPNRNAARPTRFHDGA
jgi:hypothetical protein